MRSREVDKANVGSWQGAAQRLKEKTYTLYLAHRDPRAPWYARIFVVPLVGYVFSPIDPLPDFIPVVGLLDEMVMCRERSREVMREGKKPVSRAAAVVVAVWLLLAALGVVLAFRVAEVFGT
jgi:uncharacterized membrane protein YkvA (DUF1232 family)